MPSGIEPAGSMPAIPEQKTSPLATIAWLYGPSAAGARSLDTARLVIAQVSFEQRMQSKARHRRSTLAAWAIDAWDATIRTPARAGEVIHNAKALLVDV